MPSNFLETTSHCNILCSLLYSVYIVCRCVHVVTDSSSSFITTAVSYPLHEYIAVYSFSCSWKYWLFLSSFPYFFAITNTVSANVICISLRKLWKNFCLGGEVLVRGLLCTSLHSLHIANYSSEMVVLTYSTMYF